VRRRVCARTTTDSSNLAQTMHRCGVVLCGTRPEGFRLRFRLVAVRKAWAGAELGMRKPICDDITRRLLPEFNGGLVWDT